MSLDGLLQVLSGVAGAAIGALVTLYASRQTQRQNEIVAMLNALQNDNHDLREENRELRDEVERLTGVPPKPRAHLPERTPDTP